MAPLTFVNKILAERERVRALKKSSVKVVGADVMGSTKILTSFILYPILCTFFTSSLFFLQLYYSNLTLWQNIENCIWFLVFFPIYNYICVRSIDGVVGNYNNLAIRIYALFSYDTMKSIREQRAQLAEKVNRIITQFGPKVFPNFDRMKLVKDLKKKSQRKRSDHSDDSHSQSSIASVFMINQIDFDEAFNSLSEIVI